MLITSKESVEKMGVILINQLAEDKKRFWKNMVNILLAISLTLSVIVASVLRPIKVLFF